MSDLIGIFKKLGKLKDLRTNKKTDLVSSINEVNDKANSSVSSVEAGLNYNTIKITKNDGTTENILIKVQGGSANSINVFKTAQHGGSFVATENTNTFTIEGIDSTKDVQLIYKNFFLVPNVDYTVDKETGEVGLGFTLEKDEVIYYLITDTSFDYNELNNLPDLSQFLKVTEFKNSKLVTDANECVKNGKYVIASSGLNIPPLENNYTIDVTTERDGVGTQIAKSYYGYSVDKIFIRSFIDEKFTEWKQVITTSNFQEQLRNITTVPIFMGGKGGNEGGEVHFSRADNTAWKSDLTMDIYDEALRFYIKDDYGIKIPRINFQKIEYGDLDLATVKLIDNTSYTLLNGFQRFGDTTYGSYTVRVGRLVYINYMLANNGAGNANVFKLPYPPTNSEIHIYYDDLKRIFEFRTLNDGYLYLNGSLPTDEGWTCVNLVYICKDYV